MVALIFSVKVAPSSGRIEWKLDKSNTLKCFLKSPAEQGKANTELIKEIAKRLGITKSMVDIISGRQVRNKQIKVEVDMSYDRLLKLLGVERQINIFSI